MSPVVVKLRARTLDESLALRVHAGYQPRKGWRIDRACADLDSDIVLPGVCPICPVRLDCLTEMMRAEAQHADDYIQGHAAMSARARRRWRLPHEKPIEHGSNGGYHAHHRRGETPCGPCLDAHSRYVETNRPSRVGQRRKQVAA